MAKEFWVLCAFIYLVKAETDYELYNNDGWIPITNIEAHNTRRSDVEDHYIKENGEYSSLNDFIQVVTPEVRSGKDFLPVEIVPTEYNKRSSEFGATKQPSLARDSRGRGKGHYRYFFKIANDPNKPSHIYIVKLSGSTTCVDKGTEGNLKVQSSTISDINRFDRSLKINKSTNDQLDVVTEKTLSTHEYNGNRNVKREENKILERKTYEVTEEAESDSNHGYIYETPKPNTSNKLNLTDKLFNILAKYNIRADDGLQNYDLSLRDKVRNPTASETVRPFDFKAGGYNSPDHLPVDPLLAVFLSHYGHYLPSAYGIRNNYNNAYGYLASNNIHNNKPFGMYKMFSDTDAPN